MVVLHHTGYFLLSTEGQGDPWREAWILFLRRLDLGVPIFFVISGYCITASLDASRRKGISPWRFLGRRVWRIYPPYWASFCWFLVVILSLQALGLDRFLRDRYPYGLSLADPTTLTPAQWFGNLTLTEEWRHLFFGPDRLVLTRVAWSLCYEEQFYFLCFVLLMMAKPRLYGALGVLTLLVVLVRVAAADVGALWRLEGLFVLLWHEFAIGVAVYWRLNVPASRLAKRAVDIGLALLCLGTLWRDPSGTPLDYSTPAAAAFGLLLIALRAWDEPIVKSRWMKPLRAAGKRSYSIYLCHLPICTVGNLWLYELGLRSFWERTLIIMPAVFAASVAFSWAFYWAVERHFLNPPILERAPTTVSGHTGGPPQPAPEPRT